MTESEGHISRRQFNRLAAFGAGTLALGREHIAHAEGPDPFPDVHIPSLDEIVKTTAPFMIDGPAPKNPKDDPTTTDVKASLYTGQIPGFGDVSPIMLSAVMGGGPGGMDQTLINLILNHITNRSQECFNHNPNVSKNVFDHLKDVQQSGGIGKFVERYVDRSWTLVRQSVLAKGGGRALLTDVTGILRYRLPDAVRSALSVADKKVIQAGETRYLLYGISQKVGTQAVVDGKTVIVDGLMQTGTDYKYMTLASMLTRLANHPEWEQYVAQMAANSNRFNVALRMAQPLDPAQTTLMLSQFASNLDNHPLIPQNCRGGSDATAAVPAALPKWVPESVPGFYKSLALDNPLYIDTGLDANLQLLGEGAVAVLAATAGVGIFKFLERKGKAMGYNSLSTAGGEA